MIKTIDHRNINEMSEKTRRAIDEIFNGFDFEVGGWEFYEGQTMETLEEKFKDGIAEGEEEGNENWRDLFTEIPGHGVIWAC